MYIILALLSALFASVRRASEKQLAQTLHHFTIGWSVQLFSLPITIMALALWGSWYNPLSLGYDFWLPVLYIWVCFYPLNTFLYINAIKIGELSKIMPLQSLGLVFALIFGWAFLGEKVPALAVCGILIIMFGVYVLNLKGRYLHNPLAMFTADKANLYTLGFLLLGTSVGVMDKIALRVVDPYYFSFICTSGAVVMLLLSSAIFRVKEFSAVRSNSKALNITGTLFGASFVSYGVALSMGPLAYVNALRSASLLIGSLIGVVYFKEKFTQPKKYSLALIILGSVLLAFA